MINGYTKINELLAMEEDSNSSLKHYNANHDPKTGRFLPGDGDNDGEIGDRPKRMSDKQVAATAKRLENEKKIRELTKQRNKAVESMKVLKEGSESLDRNLANFDNIKGKPVYKKYDTMSDEEINRQVSRLSREHQLSDLKGDTKYVKSGKDKAREVLQTIGTVLSAALTGALIVDILKRNKGGKK